MSRTTAAPSGHSSLTRQTQAPYCRVDSYRRPWIGRISYSSPVPAFVAFVQLSIGERIVWRQRPCNHSTHQLQPAVQHCGALATPQLTSPHPQYSGGARVTYCASMIDARCEEKALVSNLRQSDRALCTYCLEMNWCQSLLASRSRVARRPATRKISSQEVDRESCRPRVQPGSSSGRVPVRCYRRRWRRGHVQSSRPVIAWPRFQVLAYSFAA